METNFQIHEKYKNFEYIEPFKILLYNLVKKINNQLKMKRGRESY